MIPGTESCIKSAAWSLVFCMILLSSACGDDEPVEQPEAEAKAQEQPLPVREWYPRQKYSAPLSGATSQFSQPQMMQPPVFSNTQPVEQQAWRGGYQVYQAPPVIIVQPQSQAYSSAPAGQAPSQQMATPQQYAYPYYYQAPQRPWGEVQQKSTRDYQQSFTTPSAGNQQVNPWAGTQSPGGAVYPGWGVPYGGYPGITQPGYPW
jgi:hypothetical protein